MAKEVKIINMTPHAIVVSNNGIEKVYEPSGSVVRMSTKPTKVGEVDGFDVVKNVITGSNLPDPVEGTYYLVSAMVLAAFPNRIDLLAPDTNNAVRNEKGHIISVPGFVGN